VHTPPNQAPHLTGAAIMVSRGITLLQVAPAGEPGVRRYQTQCPFLLYHLYREYYA
jgi:hypothetical protein